MKIILFHIYSFVIYLGVNELSRSIKISKDGKQFPEPCLQKVWKIDAQPQRSNINFIFSNYYGAKYQRLSEYCM